MHTNAALLALLLLASCATAEDAELAAELAVVDAAELTLEVPQPEPEAQPCGAVFTPDAELLDETLAAAARWSAATGCDVRVGEDGMRVRLVAMINDADGVAEPDIWGLTYRDESGAMAIDVTPLRSRPVIPHEIGHVLFPHAGHVEDRTSLMSAEGGKRRITAADLTYVCEGFPCAAFVPEV